MSVRLIPTGYTLIFSLFGAGGLTWTKQVDTKGEADNIIRGLEEDINKTMERSGMIFNSGMTVEERRALTSKMRTEAKRFRAR